MPRAFLSPAFLPLAFALFAASMRADAQPPDCPANGDDTAILRCEKLRLAAADAALDKAYRTAVSILRGDTTPDGQAALRMLLDAQRGWIRFRDEDCDAIYLAHHAAALRERPRLRCKTLHAQMRARQLGAFDTD